MTLYDFATNEPWKFADEGGIEFFFPSSPVTIADGNCVLLVKDLTAFSSEFTAPAGVQIFEWGVGKLDNGGEKIELSMPGDVQDAERQYIRIDRVNYSDGSHDDEFVHLPGDPWPTGPDGNGESLSRLVADHYGNDVVNWQGSSPSPGLVNP